MSHGRLFRIASEWQKKKKTIWRVWSGMRKTWKMRAVALLLTAVCTVGASFAAYADDVPSGPASDMELIQRREQASGSQNEAGDAQTAAGSENHAGAAEGQQTTENQETGNNGQTYRNCGRYGTSSRLPLPDWPHKGEQRSIWKI